MPKVGHTGDNEPTHSHEERYGSRTWGDSTHKQACLQAITVATANSTYDWMANKARRTLEDVLDVRAPALGGVTERLDAQYDAHGADDDGVPITRSEGTKQR